MLRIIDLKTGKETTREMTQEEIEASKPSAETVRINRIAELRQLLRETDYVALSDYDREKPDVIAQRAEWRTELRALEND